MKLSHRNTALNLLDEITPFSFKIMEDAENNPIEYKRALGLSVVREWPKMKDGFKKKIQYITEPFYNAFKKSAHKLGTDVFEKELISESGTFIIKPNHQTVNTIFYNIETFINERGAWDAYIIIFFFVSFSGIEKPSLGVMLHRYGAGTKFYASAEATAAGLTDISILTDIIQLTLFMKYVELETKVVAANRKEKHVGEKYVNETNHNIEILDSTWFTTITRSEGFKVGGHFRLQPHGEGRSRRKLIWIDPFEKNGYTKTAKMLNQ